MLQFKKMVLRHQQKALHSERVTGRVHLVLSYLKLLIHVEALCTSSVLRSHFSTVLKTVRGKLLPVFLCVCVFVCVASAAPHTVLSSSMDKRLYLSPSALRHRHAHAHTHMHTQRSSRGICEQQSMLKATLFVPSVINAALCVLATVCAAMEEKRKNDSNKI